jgi:Cu/Ag efflux pump CusA
MVTMLPRRLFEGDRRFDIVVRLSEHLRSDIQAIEALPVPLPPVENQTKPIGTRRQIDLGEF